MQDSQTPALRSSLGLVYWAGSLLWGGLLLGCLLELFSPVQTPLQVLADVVLIPIAVVLAWLFLTWLTLRVDLYEDHLQTRSIWGRRRLEWRHAASLKPTWDSLGVLSFMQYLINLRSLKSGRLIILSLLPFHNRTDLLKGIMDLAWRGNSSIRLHDTLTAHYGYPPFGRKYHSQDAGKAPVSDAGKASVSPKPDENSSAD